MANVKDSLNSAMQLAGAIAVALVDLESGMVIGCAGGNDDFNVEMAAAANTEVVRAKLNAMSMLGLRTSVEDILITLGTQYHLIRLVNAGSQPLFLYLALDKTKANLALTRMKLAEIEKGLKV